MSAFDDAIAAPVVKDAVADLRVLDSKKRGAESRAADEVAQAVLLGTSYERRHTDVSDDWGQASSFQSGRWSFHPSDRLH